MKTGLSFIFASIAIIAGVALAFVSTARAIDESHASQTTQSATTSR